MGKSESVAESPTRRSPGDRPFYTFGQIADRWQTSTKTIRRIVKRGDLVAHKIGGQIRISHADLIAAERKNRLA